jgi:hypothetical protein
MSFDRWVLVLFVLGAWFLSGSNQLKVLGLLLSLGFIYKYVTSDQRWKFLDHPPETFSYTLWGVWVGATGLIVCTSIEIFYTNYRTLVLTCIMIWIVYGMLRQKLDDRLLYKVIIIASLGHIAAVQLGYTMELSTGEIITDAAASGDDRVAGLVGNANGLGFVMVYGVECAILLWRMKRSSFNIFWKLFLILFVLLSAYITFSTGSRKTAAAIVVLIVGWLVWLLPIGKGVSTLFVRLGMIGLTLVISVSAFSFLIHKTLVGERFTQLSDRGKGSIVVGVEEDIRYEMYQEGLRMFREHPVAGVGLGHFNVYFWKGLYSHSDYIEPLACTGLVGFLLYHSFYFFLFRRLLKLYRRVRNGDEKYQIGGMLLALSVHLVLGFGSPYWQSQRTFILLIIFVTYTWMLEEKYKRPVMSVSGARLARPNYRAIVHP